MRNGEDKDLEKDRIDYKNRGRERRREGDKRNEAEEENWLGSIEPNRLNRKPGIY